MPLSSDTVAAAATENPDGTLLGRNADSKVGFFGATPAVQPAALSLASVTAAQLATALASLGLIKTTA
ncbi:hypothetical protein N7670_09710 [Stenotrophomonas maltophilia]|uniref:hypothetical protein n=1 Tax=Stenotrophomonas maltophilia TaxID=40324 RepID=UPI0015627574|nr:hypothetical protein [Stenotrophomonas maltophilia]MDG9939694.1 hypothetical protein [Stenotrophomonas maltophilia]MDH0559487.1 hypothetical protein [Stenotrophomonas maltophilia]NRP03292.1 hypothetical protein [Stenotrophomonas maltophilia]